MIYAQVRCTCMLKNNSRHTLHIATHRFGCHNKVQVTYRDDNELGSSWVNKIPTYEEIELGGKLHPCSLSFSCPLGL
jgi:hypothetical protein